MTSACQNLMPYCQMWKIVKKRKAAERKVADLTAKLKFTDKNRFGDKRQKVKKTESIKAEESDRGKDEDDLDSTSDWQHANIFGK